MIEKKWFFWWNLMFFRPKRCFFHFLSTRFHVFGSKHQIRSIYPFLKRWNGLHSKSQESFHFMSLRPTLEDNPFCFTSKGEIKPNASDSKNDFINVMWPIHVLYSTAFLIRSLECKNSLAVVDGHPSLSNRNSFYSILSVRIVSGRFVRSLSSCFVFFFIVKAQIL